MPRNNPHPSILVSFVETIFKAVSEQAPEPLRHDFQFASKAPVALFDASHGQPNWSQTGYPSREMHTNFAGLTEMLCRLGFQCRTTAGQPLPHQLPRTRLLVVPPPTGRYDARREQWRRESSTRFTDQDVLAVADFIQNGGRLLAFAYRFGDSFTQTNLGDVFVALGCRLNDDAVIDARAVRQTTPLEFFFDTLPESLPMSASRIGVTNVRWRPSATFDLLPGATAWPLALSPGGSCLSFNRTLRHICFESLPLAVAGRRGQGRFALFGGPHVFETSSLGLFAHGDNARFLKNVIGWLLDDSDCGDLTGTPTGVPDHSETCSEFSRVESRGDGMRTITSVERVLRKTGVLKALNRSRWMP